MSKISKLGLGIIAFEGTEHLANIINEIKPSCDIVVVCLQQESYHKEPIDPADVEATEKLKELGYIDEIIWFNAEDYYTDDPINGPRKVETDKRNFILEYLEKEQGCSHSLVIDSDEYYDRDDFANAKKYIDASNDIHVTYCIYINYYRDYVHLLIWPYLAYVPFITEASYRYNFSHGSFDKPSDPTRRYLMEGEHKIYHTLGYKLIKMHHLSWIRKDISKKIDNWSGKNIFKNVPNLKEMIIHRYTNYKEGQNAIITLRTPMYQIAVNKLPKQYIHPKFTLYDKITPYEDSSINT